MRIASSTRTGRTWRLLLALALVVALVPMMPGGAAAASVVYYVDAAAGSDASAGSATVHVKTITHAMSTAVDGDTNVVRDGTSDPAIGAVIPIAVNRGVTLRAKPAD